MDSGRESIDHGAAMPVWRQLAAILRARILDGRLPPGRMIPSEKACEQEFGTARGTCRKAVALLRDEGLVITVAGRGSYVVSEDELRRLRT
jgi:DNA-binding GntR family transcriptional regulator